MGRTAVRGWLALKLLTYKGAVNTCAWTRPGRHPVFTNIFWIRFRDCIIRIITGRQGVSSRLFSAGFPGLGFGFFGAEDGSKLCQHDALSKAVWLTAAGR